MNVPEELANRIVAYLQGKMEEAEINAFHQAMENSEELRREVAFQQQLKGDLEAMAFSTNLRKITQPEEDSPPSDSLLSQENEVPLELEWVEDMDTLFEIYFEPETDIPEVYNNYELNQILQRAKVYLDNADFPQVLKELDVVTNEFNEKDEEALIHYLKANMQLAISPPEVESAINNLLFAKETGTYNLVGREKTQVNLALAYLKKGDIESSISYLRQLLADEETSEESKKWAAELLHILEERA